MTHKMISRQSGIVNHDIMYLGLNSLMRSRPVSQTHREGHHGESLNPVCAHDDIRSCDLSQVPGIGGGVQAQQQQLVTALILKRIHEANTKSRYVDERDEL